ncbi:MAG: alpha/beta hydrolase family protein, partial [Acidimicrobiales bacterium]
STTIAPPDPNRRWAVGVLHLDLVDSSRSTPAAGGQPAQRGRHLPTVVRYPVGAAPGVTFPLVVFAHGYATSPDTYSALLDAWAQAGYVVAAPSFPLASSGGPLDEADVVHQAADLSFVVSAVLARAAGAAGGPLGGLVDPSRIGAAGHSDGGETVMGMVFNSCCQDPRVRAGIVMSGCECVYPDAGWFRGPPVPILVAQGDRDPINDVSASTQIFGAAPGPRFLTDLVGGGHLEPFTTDTAHLRAFVAVSLDFLDRYLKGRPDALARLRRDGAAPGLTLRTGGA